MAAPRPSARCVPPRRSSCCEPKKPGFATVVSPGAAHYSRRPRLQGSPTMPRTLLLSLLFSSSLCAQSAYCVDTNLDILYSVDLSTGAVTSIGSTLNGGLDTAADLCWKDDTSEI